jgi:hypothetical protein
MAVIKEDKVAFNASWKGRTDYQDGTVKLAFELPETEQTASVYIFAICQRQLYLTVHVDSDKVEIGTCRFKHLSGKENGDSTIFFQTDLSSLLMTSQQQLLFKEKLLACVVKVYSNEKREN